MKIKNLRLTAALVVMGVLIISFNIMGYNLLFKDESVFPFINVTPFALLLGCAEVAVLMWTSAVISNWRNAHFLLKGAMFLIVPAFAFLCYSGINSYLNTLATADIKAANEVKLKKENNKAYIATLEQEVSEYSSTLAELTKQVVPLSEQIELKMAQISLTQAKASERRLGSLVCDENPDCKAAVTGFENEVRLLNAEVEQLSNTRHQIQNDQAEIKTLLSQANSILRQEKLTERELSNSVVGNEAGFNLKKKSYEAVVVTTASWLGIELKDPFGAFVSFISAIIYPVYFLLNLFLSLSGDQELSQLRAAKKAMRAEIKLRNWSTRNILLKTIADYLKVGIKQRMLLRKMMKKNKLKPQPGQVAKLIKYVRTLKRKSTRTIRDIKIVEKVIEVPKEVAVYVDRVQTVSEPMIIKEPQVIIHERIIPVPDTVTAKELEELLGAQPKLNEGTLGA